MPHFVLSTAPHRSITANGSTSTSEVLPGKRGNLHGGTRNTSHSTGSVCLVLPPHHPEHRRVSRDPAFLEKGADRPGVYPTPLHGTTSGCCRPMGNGLVPWETQEAPQSSRSKPDHAALASAALTGPRTRQDDLYPVCRAL